MIIGTKETVSNDALIAHLRDLDYDPKQVLYEFPVFNHKRKFGTEELINTIQDKYGLEEQLAIDDSMLEVIYLLWNII